MRHRHAIDGDHVEAHVEMPDSVLPEPTLRKPAHTDLFLEIDGCRGATETGTPTSLDFAEYDQIVEPGDEIEVATQFTL